MKPPKNFYSNLDRRKQGLPEVPEASASDSGKIIKVGSDGSYELGNMPEVPRIVLPLAGRPSIMIGTSTQITPKTSPVLKAQWSSSSNIHTMWAYDQKITNDNLSRYIGATIEVEYDPEDDTKYSLWGILFRKSSSDFYVIGVGISRTATEPVRKLIHITYSDATSTDVNITFTDLPFNGGAEATPLNYFQLPRGNSSILLGFKPTDCDEVIINYHTNGTPGTHMSVISTDQTSWDTRRAVNIHYDGTSWYCCNTSIGSYQEGEFEFKFDMVNGKVYRDNTELISFDNSSTLNDHELKIGDLGGLSGSSNYGAYFKRIQGIKNGQLIHDLIPMKIGDNSYFFIDQISGTIVGGKNWTIATDTIGG